jgi:hypothetical protein
MVESAKASGPNQQKLDETERKAQQFKQMYANPAINVAMTFTEVFPIGLVVTVVSAGILRKKARPGKHREWPWIRTQAFSRA